MRLTTLSTFLAAAAVILTCGDVTAEQICRPTLNVSNARLSSPEGLNVSGPRGSTSTPCDAPPRAAVSKSSSNAKRRTAQTWSSSSSSNGRPALCKPGRSTCRSICGSTRRCNPTQSARPHAAPAGHEPYAHTKSRHAFAACLDKQVMARSPLKHGESDLPTRRHAEESRPSPNSPGAPCRQLTPAIQTPRPPLALDLHRSATRCRRSPKHSASGSRWPR